MPDLTDVQLALLERILDRGSVSVDDLSEDELANAVYLRKNLHLLGGGFSSFSALPETSAVVDDAKNRRKQQADQKERQDAKERSQHAEDVKDRKQSRRHDFCVAAFSVTTAFFFEHLSEIVHFIKHAFDTMLSFFKH